MYYQTLENVPLETIYKAFIEAFSDYQVPMNLQFDQFTLMLIRRGYDASLSVGAFEKEKCVGFVLNGVRNWNGNQTIYDLGTGVIPSFRKQKVITHVLEEVKQLCVNKEIHYYLLEVLCENQKAINLYLKQGFEMVRTLDCYYVKAEHILGKIKENIQLVTGANFEENTWNTIKGFWNSNPSWQNSIDSINATSSDFHYVLAYMNQGLVGYGIISKRGGDLVQLAVAREYRNCGVGHSLVLALARISGASSVSMLNVDATDVELSSFLTALGFRKFVSQYEMLQKLS